MAFVSVSLSVGGVVSMSVSVNEVWPVWPVSLSGGGVVFVAVSLS